MIKKTIILLALISTMLSNAQISDLSKLASGKTELFELITNKDGKVYGYFAIFNLEDKSKDKTRFKYFFLDKNLRKVMDGEFIDKEYSSFNHNFINVDKVGSKFILSKGFYYKKRDNREFQFTSFRVLDLKTNKMSNEFYYEDEKFVDGTRDENTLKSLIRNKKTFISIPLSFSKGIVMIKSAKKGKTKLSKIKKSIQILKAYDLDRNELWSFNYNPDNKDLDFYIELNNKNNFIISTKENKVLENEKLYSINPETGKTKFTYSLNKKGSNVNVRYRLYESDKGIVIIGNKSKKRAKGFDFNYDFGVFNITLDKDSGKELINNKFYWNEEGSSKMNLDRAGRLNGKDGLLAYRFFVFKNSKSAIINILQRKKLKEFEFLRPPNGIAVLNFDDQFKLSNYKIMNNKAYKLFSLGGASISKVLFSQKIKEGNGVVFFLQDYNYFGPINTPKIVTIIDGKINIEDMPKPENDDKRYLFKAKEGYVLIRDVNIKEETDKIHLEKLNF